jgi:hypothetical protein
MAFFRRFFRKAPQRGDPSKKRKPLPEGRGDP